MAGLLSLAVVVLLCISLISAQSMYYGNKCHLTDEPLEVRESAADLVFSGKVISVHRNTHNSSYYCSISIFRVMQGNSLVISLLDLPTDTKLLYNRTLEVSGFGNEQICDSEVNVGDTRIFLTSYHRFTNLTLNSSVARVGVRTLRKSLAGKQS